MNRQPSSPSEQDRQLAKLLAAGLDYTPAGEQVGLSKASVYRRMKDADFRALVDSEREDRTESLVELLASAASASVKLLRDVVTDPEETTANQVRAAGIVLAELARRVTPQQVQMSGTLGVEQVESMSAEEVAAALAGLVTEASKTPGVAKLLGPPDDSADTGKVYDPAGVPVAAAAVRRPELPGRSEDQTPTEAAEDVAAADVTSEDSGSGQDASEDVAANVVPLKNPDDHQPDAARQYNPWRRNPRTEPLWPS
jgi:hypothetical protein